MRFITCKTFPPLLRTESGKRTTWLLSYSYCSILLGNSIIFIIFLFSRSLVIMCVAGGVIIEREFGINRFHKLCIYFKFFSSCEILSNDVPHHIEKQFLVIVLLAHGCSGRWCMHVCAISCLLCW